MSIFHGAGWSEGTFRQADAGDRQGDSGLSDDPTGQLGIAPAIVTGKPLPLNQQDWRQLSQGGAMGMPSPEQCRHFPPRARGLDVQRPGNALAEGLPARERSRQLLSRHGTRRGPSALLGALPPARPRARRKGPGSALLSGQTLPPSEGCTGWMATAFFPARSTSTFFLKKKKCFLNKINTPPQPNTRSDSAESLKERPPRPQH